MQAKTVLCPIDFSATTERAIDLASTIASESRGVLVILHVTKFTMSFDGEIHGETVRYAADLMDSLQQVQPTRAHVRCVRSLQWGNPEQVILETAEKQHADLIVMGTHGRTGWRRLLLGSVAEHVVRRARCPVLMVKQPADVGVSAVA